MEECTTFLEGTVLLGGVGQEIDDTAGVTPLVVVPGDQLHEVGAELDTGVGVEDRGVLVAGEVGGDDLLVGVAEDTLVGGLGGLLDGGLDLLVGRALLKTDDEIDDGDIESGDTEGETTMRKMSAKMYAIRVYENTYVSLPLSSGMTLPTALAAPVEEGMMLLLTERPPRQSLLEGPSTVFWVAVVAWTVVIKPSTIPNLSLITLARGARQLVVQDALEI